jgi:two-component system OmpR family sensor kinase
MNRHSIRFKINLIFAISFIALLSMTHFVWDFEKRSNHHDIFHRLSNIASALHVDEWKDNLELLDTLSHSHDFVIVDGKEKDRLLLHKHHEHMENENPQLKPPMRPFNAKGVEYVHYQVGDTDILFKDNSEQNRFPFMTLLMLAVLLLLVFLYYFVRKNLLPLKMMQEQIKRYGDGKDIEALKDDSKDELSALYKEFYESVQRMNKLHDARRLFLRNIMHELNTPIAKGKLIATLTQDSNKNILESIFERLDLLVKELATIEKLSSGNYELKMRDYLIVDIIDNAMDLLYLDSVEYELHSVNMRCDFEMMSIVFKNLIDNAYKHGSNLYIKSEKEKISFISEGEILKRDFQVYLEPFRKNEQHENSQNGLGLGLYIVNEMLTKQGYSLKYFHLNGKNFFEIVLE